MLNRILKLFKHHDRLDRPVQLVGADMHAHWLPGIDDGAPDLATSLQMIRKLQSLGCRRLIATPHVMVDLYPNSTADILDALERTRDAAQQAGIDVKLEAAAEYLVDEGFSVRLRNDDLLTFGDRCVLFELGFIAPPPDLDGILFELLTRQYRPVLAHPERYQYYHRDFDRYRKLHDRGIALQVNLLSLTGHYGSAVREVAESLIAEGLVNFWGTDAHHSQHLDKIKELLGRRSFEKLLAGQTWQNAQL